MVLILKHKFLSILATSFDRFFKKDINYSGARDLPVDQILPLSVLKKSSYITFYKMG